eukprot:scaffold227_cov236-Chaetoceros_neogracile.AAC.8
MYCSSSSLISEATNHIPRILGTAIQIMRKKHQSDVKGDTVVEYSKVSRVSRLACTCAFIAAI